MRKVEKPAYMRKTAFVCMLENGWSFRALFRTFQPFCKNLLRRHSKITITRAKNSRQGHWSVACLKMLKGNYNQCNKHSFSDQYFENLVTSVEKKTPGPEIRIYLYWDRWAINRNYSHWRLEGIYGMCGILCSSARPKPSFGIGNWNQVQVSVSVSGP